MGKEKKWCIENHYTFNQKGDNLLQDQANSIFEPESI